MASAPHRLQDSRATVPAIVLPITSRGLTVTDAVCWAVLGVAMAVAAGLGLYLSRGMTFNVDQMSVFLSSPHLSLRDVLEPENGHLGATTRLTYKAILEVFGAGSLAFRIVHLAVMLLAAALFFMLATRRIGAVPALAPTIVLLFLGSDWGHVATPLGFTVMSSVAMGLGALIALERNDRGGDIAACALITLSVATFSAGLAFLVGAAASVVLREDRRRRIWIFAVPLGLYAAWWLWALSLPEVNSATDNTKLSNALLIPGYFADSLAAVTGALTGVAYEFGGSPPPEVEVGWGRVLAVLAVVGLALRIRRGGVPAPVWVGLGIVFTYWALGAFAYSSIRPPGLERYLYMGAVGVLLVATAAAASLRFSRLGLIALYAAAGIGLATNLAVLRDGAAYYRDAFSQPARAQFAMLELARPHVDPGFDPNTVPGAAPIRTPAEPYFAAIDRFGSPASSPSEIERQPEKVRENADLVLATALQLHLEPAARSRSAPEGCRPVEGEPAGGSTIIELPPGGAGLRAQSASGAPMDVGRFGAPSVGVGNLRPGRKAVLRIPADSSPKPWTAAVSGAASVEVCELS